MDIQIKPTKIKHPDDIFEVIQIIFYRREGEVDLMKEHLWAFSLNKQKKILSLELVSMGTKDRTVADPGDIFRVPLYKSSSYVILVHNHPSGGLKPSQSDMDLTNKLIKAGDLLDISVIDHVIVTDKSFFSFATAGLMDKLQEDNKYALSFVYKKKMKKKMEELKRSVEKEKLEFGKIKLKEGKEKGKLEGAKKRNQEIAKQMLSEGIEKDVIARVTGLTHQWIGRIKNQLESKKT